MSEIWITGYGVVSAIGVGKQETLDSLLTSRSGLAEVAYLETAHHEFPVGEVKMSNEAMMDALGIARDKAMTRTALLGMMALGETLADAGIGSEVLGDVAFVSGTTVGGMDQSEKHYLDFLSNDDYNQYIATHDCGACTEMIGDHYGRFASVTTLSTACSSAANAVIYGASLIANNVNKMAVVGGAECITKFHLNGFNSLKILDEEPCRPFDSTRAGINLGEGAAYLVLEEATHARQRGVRPYAVLAGYGNACDAYHQTASSPDGEGPFRAMHKALLMAGVDPRQIDYVNAHGTGTHDNDVSESAAMRRLFGSEVPPVSSTKPFTGHTTSASGTIEAAICLLAMQHGFIPPNLNFKNADDCVAPVSEIRRNVHLDYVLCNSFGFGGNDSSLLFTTLPCGVSERCSLREHSPFADGVYVYAASQISTQLPMSESWIDAPIPLDEGYNRSQEPDFREYIQPLEARRMGRLLKRTVAVSADALAKSGIAMPDAIVGGTGLGCVEYTEQFLDPLCREGEQLLKPSYFMQSTHNTVSSSLAIRLKCHGYNATYAHKSISFDSALNDAYMQVCDGRANSALVCGFDEVTPSYYGLLKKIGFLGQPGEPSGESSVAVVIGNERVGERPLCRLTGIKMLYCPTSEQIASAVDELLNENGNLTQKAQKAQKNEKRGLDAILLGKNGDNKVDRLYDELMAAAFPPSFTPIEYKNIFGECYTASALGFYTAVMYMLKHKFNKVLVCNFDDGKNCSLILVER